MYVIAHKVPQVIVFAMEALPWFISSLRLTMRARYQATNQTLALALSEFAIQHGLNDEPAFTGTILKTWGNPGRSHRIEDYQLRTMYRFYLDRELLPDNEQGWMGLMAVHQQIQGGWEKLPDYLKAADGLYWADRYQQRIKETA